MPILAYIKLGVLAVAMAAVAYFVWDYRSMQDEITEQALQVATAQAATKDAQQQLVDKVAEHNQAMSRLQESFYAEREQRALAERNYAESNDKIADLMADAQDEKAKYESGRLARLAAAKGGLISRLAKSGAKRRNTEWEALVE